MRRLLPPLIVIFALAGPAAAESRAVSGFTGVSADDRFTIEIVTGSAYSVEVTGRDARRIRTELDGRVLRVRDANRPWFGENPRLDAHIRVTAPALRTISAVRGAELTADLRHTCGALDVAAAMGGSARVNAACDVIDASASMGANVTLAGTCRALDVSASMGGIVRADDLQCQSVDASASMGGEVAAYASQTYDASASMGGAINVAGNAPSRETSSSLGGDINHR